jgi:ribosomal protein S18 acetylase RimI-like enzyme
MNIIYDDTKKDLPCEQLYQLFLSAGWANEANTTGYMKKHFNQPFINSKLVVSAWDDGLLVGVVRVLSDKIIRSVIHDLVVLPEYKNKGIGKELVRRCIKHFPNSEWLVQTEKETSSYYEKMGFKIYNNVVLTIPSIYQRIE